MVSPESHEVIHVPQGVTVTITGSSLKVKGKNGELSRAFPGQGINLKREGNDVVVHADLPRKKTRALVGTYAAHIRNMVRGATENYEYKMKICFSHFPIKTKITGDQFVIENFLGERTPRRARIMGATKVKVAGEEISLTGPNVEDVSQTAANIEQATTIRGFDIRVFQDGIYITSKGA
ncbi:MAG: large subunit ribosomal protein [Thermoplasmata archaeon]|jgi:large subunit ribosomal protein L6|nr:large subunit ribosomal protein [Thermoplasmata archaeon]